MVSEHDLPLNQIIQGHCVDVLDTFPENSVDLIFADPPYNLQLSQELWRPNMTRVEAVKDAWDQFSDFHMYDQFCKTWLKACRRVLKETGTLWVIGSYHNIFRVGTILLDLGYWILNDVIWLKTNPMPNFRGVRFTNAHETLIWASKSKKAKYTFNHQAMKSFNEGKQMRSDWLLPICVGRERIKVKGKRAHSTQKPEALLYRVILASSNPGDLVVDPFFGSGTTGAVAKKLHRNWIGIEKETKYVELAQARIDKVFPEKYDQKTFDVRGKKRHAPRVATIRLLENGLLNPGQRLYFRKDLSRSASVKPDGKLLFDGYEGSIHQVGKHILGGSPCNGWEHWYYLDAEGAMQPIDNLRQVIRQTL